MDSLYLYEFINVSLEHPAAHQTVWLKLHKPLCFQGHPFSELPLGIPRGARLHLERCTVPYGAAKRPSGKPQAIRLRLRSGLPHWAVTQANPNQIRTGVRVRHREAGHPSGEPRICPAALCSGLPLRAVAHARGPGSSVRRTAGVLGIALASGLQS